MEKRGKKAIMQLPFGMIFSIFLIAIFIVLAFFVIREFLSWKKCADVGLFYRDLEENVDRIFSSQITKNMSFEIKLPSGIDFACFVDTEKSLSGEFREKYNSVFGKNINLFFTPSENACNMGTKKINRINITELTDKRNPYCLKNKEEIKLEKGLYDSLVRISR